MENLERPVTKKQTFFERTMNKLYQAPVGAVRAADSRPYRGNDGGNALIAGPVIPAARFGGVWAPRPTHQVKNTA